MTENMSRGGRRVRRSIADNYGLVLVCVLLVGAVGGYLTYTTHVDPGTVTETREVSSWQSSGEFTHQATVVDGTAAFSEGAVLRNRTVYFRDVSPRLNGSFAYAYTGAGDSDLATETTVELRYRSVDTNSDSNETVYWQVNRTLSRGSAESLESGDRTTVPFSTNASAAIAEAQQIDAELGGTPGSVQVALVAHVDISGTRNGQQVDSSRTYRLPVVPGQGVYRVQDRGPVTATGSQTEQVTRPAEYGPLRRAAGPLLLGFAACALAALLFARQTGRLAVSEAEQRWLAYRSARAEFDDWITTGQVPASGDETAVTVDSLNGLVDVAIDTNNRVIEHASRGEYVVLDGTHLYRYTRPKEPESSAGRGEIEEEGPPSSEDSPTGLAGLLGFGDSAASERNND